MWGRFPQQEILRRLLKKPGEVLRTISSGRLFMAGSSMPPSRRTPLSIIPTRPWVVGAMLRSRTLLGCNLVQVLNQMLHLQTRRICVVNYAEAQNFLREINPFRKCPPPAPVELFFVHLYSSVDTPSWTTWRTFTDGCVPSLVSACGFIHRKVIVRPDKPPSHTFSSQEHWASG